jgi:hypothetical protein
MKTSMDGAPGWSRHIDAGVLGIAGNFKVHF